MSTTPSRSPRPPAAGRPGVTSSNAPLRIGTVSLVVRDLDAVSRFYQHMLGLRLIEAQPGLARLGAGDTALLELRHDQSAPPANPRDAGLFHVAYLLPSRADLARWLRHAAELGVRLQGASDHLVSEALYLADPEGNGIEVYADRPSEAWHWRDGLIEMATKRLDLDGLAADAGDRSWSGMPNGSQIGHVHLQVGALEPAERFYAGLLGLDVTSRYPGATFFSTGGYHHHLATNTWNSADAPVRQVGAAGLASVELVPANDEVRTDLARRFPAVAEGRSLSDPWGTQLVVRPA